MYGCENWTVNKAGHQRTDAFKPWYRKTLESPLDSKEIKPVNPKGNQPWISIWRTDAEVEAPKLWPPDVKSQLTGKDPDAGKDWRQEEEGMTEDKMVGWHQRLNRQEFEQILRDSEGQGSLVGYSPWGSQRAGHDWATEQQLLNAYFASDQSWWLIQPSKADMCSGRCFR